MAPQYLCGNCGTVLDHQAATCRSCGAQSAGAVRRFRRSPRAAAALAVIPGLGHIYLGHTVKGLAYMLGAGGLEFIGLDLDATLVLAPLGIPAGLGGIGLWMHGIYDAYHTAKRMELDGTL